MSRLAVKVTVLFREIEKSVETRGYYYVSDFSDPHDGRAALLLLASRMGSLYTQNELINSDPIVTTRPTARATTGRPFDKPETGKIAVKVINHYGDEVLKVFEI